MFKNNATDHKLNVEAIIKNINIISLELKKMKELSQLLLCDLTLHFNHPVKTDDLQEPEGKTPLSEESKIPDLSFASTSFSI
uniref:Chromosome 5 open reading frame 58 n=2 Tax=Ailuropoda melanoleuca TaxID=9646 RepID=A0A7N5P5S6_AILME